MKKLVSVLICIIMILSVLPTNILAADVTEPVFIDFEDCVAGGGTEYKVYALFSSSDYETTEVDEEHGKSVKLFSGLSEYLNCTSVLDKNAVFGFSYLSNDSESSLLVSSKVTNKNKNEKGMVDVNSILGIEGSTIKVNKAVAEVSYEKGKWLDVLLAMDYENHKIGVYINGKHISTIETNNTNFIGTDRFNISITKDKKSDANENMPAELIFDNMFVYYPPEGVNVKAEGNLGDDKADDSIFVDFGQNVLSEDFSAAAKLNGEIVETEPFSEHGYVTGLNLKNLKLSGSTEYKIEFLGICDFLGNGISGHTFTTISTEPTISIKKFIESDSYEAGENVKFIIESANLNNNQISIYYNDEVLETLSADEKEFSVVLKGGNNEIYAKVEALSVQSEIISIYVDNTPVIGISYDKVNEIHKSGESVKIKIDSANLDGNSIDVYQNDELKKTISSDTKEISLVLDGGNNEIYASVPAFNLKSEKLVISAEAYGVIGDDNLIDFEDGSTGKISNVGSAEGTISVKDTDEEHGKSLYFELDGKEVDATVASNKPFIIVEQFTDKNGIYVFEADFNFSQVQEAGNLFPLKCKKAGKDVWNTLYVLEGGNIKLKEGSKAVIYSGIKADKWYRLKALWNSATSTSEFYVNNELVASDVPFSTKDIDSYVYVNMSLNTKTGAKASMYMDNIKSYFMGKMANVIVDYDGASSDEVPYENAIINLTFDNIMKDETLKGVKLIDEIGMETQVDFVSDDNMHFKGNMPILKPNVNYVLEFKGIRSESEVGVSSTKAKFKTKKAPFAIKEVRSSVSGKNINVDVDIQNINAEEKSYIVIVASYVGNMMISSDAKAYKSNKEETAEFSLLKPNGEYKVEVYVFDSAKTMNLIDKFIFE